jgi:hypothetical protein
MDHKFLWWMLDHSNKKSTSFLAGQWPQWNPASTHSLVHFLPQFWHVLVLWNWLSSHWTYERCQNRCKFWIYSWKEFTRIFAIITRKACQDLDYFLAIITRKSCQDLDYFLAIITRKSCQDPDYFLASNYSRHIPTLEKLFKVRQHFTCTGVWVSTANMAGPVQVPFSTYIRCMWVHTTNLAGTV